ncbi:ParB N-terminal domain-containing protein [uncultured Anaerococcus sp.]|uniref:ParB N-terminal domain-containing protein n=1 Tax=uncultured Anaerococcus sp. TaxID=293428 RepID=UPI00288C57CE|nr:ParB N-terminal domain-containing protein [uncultured Anaerococcus sp.]
MLIDIEKVKVGDRIRKDMGDLKELSDDIAKNGLINPPVVTPDFELIAGERRLEAMKKLGYKQVEVRIMKVEDAEHKLNLEINENENRKDFNKSERIEYARQLERIERVKAKERQGNRTDLDVTQNFVGSETDDIVARKLEIGSGEQYRKEKYIADNADPETLEQWNNEEISTHKAYTKVKELEKQLEESTAANKRLADKVIELEQREPEIIEKEVIPEDYKDLQDELKELMAYQKELENKLYELQKEPKEEVKEVIKEVDRADIRYYKSEIKRLKDDLQKEITKNLSLINDKKLAISQLETEEAHRKRVSDITSMHYSIAGFLRSIGGQLYLTEYLEEVTPRERNLYLDSVKHLREFSEQLYINCEEAIKKYRS